MNDITSVPNNSKIYFYLVVVVVLEEKWKTWLQGSDTTLEADKVVKKPRMNHPSALVVGPDGEACSKLTSSTTTVLSASVEKI